MGERAGLDDEAVRERVARLDALLERLERLAGPTAELALETVEALTEVYGEALARVVARVAATPTVVRDLADDELVGHLMVLHGLHPDPVEERVARALDDVRPYLHSHGGDVELADVADGTARVRLSGSCGGCSSSSTTLETAVTDAVLAAAPELSGVAALPAERPAGVTLIPVEALLRRPAALVGDPGTPG